MKRSIDRGGARWTPRRGLLGTLGVSVAVALFGVMPAVLIGKASPAAALTTRPLVAPYATDATSTSKTCTASTPATTTCAVSAVADRSTGRLEVGAAVAKGAAPDGAVGGTAQAHITAVDRLESSATRVSYAVTLDVRKASAVAAAVAGRAEAEVVASITATGPCAGNGTCTRTAAQRLASTPTTGAVTITVTLEAAEGFLLDAGNVDLRISLSAGAAADGTTEVDSPPLLRICGGSIQYLSFQFCEWDVLPDYSSTNPNYRGTADAAAAVTITAVEATYDRRPLAPRGPWAEPIDSAVKVDWEPAVSPLPLSAYRIYRNDALVGEVSGSTSSFVDTTVTNGLSYRYSVTAVNADGEGPRGPYEATAAAMGQPSTPTDLAANPYGCAAATEWAGSERVDTHGGAVLSWHAPPDVGRPVEHYLIRRGTTPFSTEPVMWVSGGSFSGLLATVVDCSVPSSGTYYYDVTAVNRVGTSARSNTAAVVVPDMVDPTGERPRAPVDVSATATSPSSIRVAWNPPPAELTPIVRYHVFETNAHGWEYLRATVNGDQRSWTDTSYLSPGKTRSYFVRAENLDGQGDRSAVVSATVPATVPSAVPNFSGNSGAGPQRNKVQLYWSAAADGGSPITAYRIYRGTTSANTTLLKSVSGSDTTYLDGDVTRGKTYYYRITAVNAIGEGPSSATISVTA